LSLDGHQTKAFGERWNRDGGGGSVQPAQVRVVDASERGDRYSRAAQSRRDVRLGISDEHEPNVTGGKRALEGIDEKHRVLARFAGSDGQDERFAEWRGVRSR